MNFKNLLLAAVLFFVAHSAQAMHSTVTIHTNSYPTASILPLYLPATPTYAPISYPAYNYYSYWPTTYYYDDYYWDYYDTPVTAVAKGLAAVGVIALAAVLLDVIFNH